MWSSEQVDHQDFLSWIKKKWKKILIKIILYAVSPHHTYNNISIQLQIKYIWQIIKWTKVKYSFYNRKTHIFSSTQSLAFFYIPPPSETGNNHDIIFCSRHQASHNNLDAVSLEIDNSNICHRFTYNILASLRCLTWQKLYRDWFLTPFDTQLPSWENAYRCRANNAGTSHTCPALIPFYSYYVSLC
jgi:hypothetical protein